MFRLMFQTFGVRNYKELGTPRGPSPSPNHQTVANRCLRHALAQQQKPLGQTLDDRSLSEQEIFNDLRSPVVLEGNRWVALIIVDTLT